MRRLRALAASALVLVSTACGGGGGSGVSTISPPGPPGPFEGVTFAVDETDDGVRLRIRVGDEVVARLALRSRSAPPWRVSSVPNPRILTTGDLLRVAPSEPAGPEPYDEFTFRAVGTGTAGIEFTHAGSGGSLEITVIVTRN